MSWVTGGDYDGMRVGVVSVKRGVATFELFDPNGDDTRGEHGEMVLVLI